MAFNDTAVDAAVASFASKTTTAGAATGAFGFLMSSTFFGLAGVFIAVVGFLVNLHFQRRRDKREQEEHLARMAEIRSNHEVS